ncbi:MAG: EVE domain-containing protein [Chloroflexi bacterium]|nr:EVE domain-containing protein [Chloroflexota bacterium]
MAQRGYWVFKTEPRSYSFQDMVREGVGQWDGVRNFQARNSLRDDVKEGDAILIYHSGATAKAVVGTAVVVRSGYPDHTAWTMPSDHPDPKSTPQNPIWYMVDVRAEREFAHPVTLDEIKAVPALAETALAGKSRLSIQPLSEAAWNLIVQLGGDPTH